jgi:hypothetical protein
MSGNNRKKAARVGTMYRNPPALEQKSKNSRSKFVSFLIISQQQRTFKTLKVLRIKIHTPHPHIPSSHILIISNVHEVGTCIRNLRLDHHGASVSVCILIEGI